MTLQMQMIWSRWPRGLAGCVWLCASGLALAQSPTLTTTQTSTPSSAPTSTPAQTTTQAPTKNLEPSVSASPFDARVPLSEVLISQPQLRDPQRQAFTLGTQWLVPEEEATQRAQKERLIRELQQSQDSWLPSWNEWWGKSVGGKPYAREALAFELQNLPVTGRVLLPNTDPFAMSAKPSLNPKIAPNQTVIVPTVPNSVTVIREDGVICSPRFRAGVLASHYTALCQDPYRSKPDWAWLIQPDGTISKVGLQNWNTNPQAYPAPGAWIFAPARNAAYTESFSWEFARYLATLGPSGSSALLERFSKQTPRRLDHPDELAQSRARANGVRPLPLIPNDFGTLGLLQTPSARLADAGQVSINASRVYPYARYNFMFTPLSWFEFGFRYTRTENVIVGSIAAQDKSIPLKFKLTDESQYVPQIALGFTDIGGTGLFAGEYLVGSKRMGNFDLSLGLGWGYNGARGNLNNPLSVFGGRFSNRVAGSSSPQGGNFNPNGYFTGPTALFGGVQYHTPVNGLVLKAELDGNNYQHEPQQSSPFSVRSPLGSNYPINVGATYMWENVYLTLGLERGNQAMISLTLTDNLGILNRSQLSQKKAIPVAAKPIFAPASAGLVSPTTSSMQGMTSSPSSAATMSTASSMMGIQNGSLLASSKLTSNAAGIKTVSSATAGSAAKVSNAAGVTAASAAAPSAAPITSSSPSYQAIIKALSRQSGWDAVRLQRVGSEWWVDFENVRAIYIQDTLNQVVALLHRDAPNTITTFRIRLLNKDLEVVEYRIDRAQWMREQTELLPPSARKPYLQTEAFTPLPSRTANIGNASQATSFGTLNPSTKPTEEETLAIESAKRFDYGFGLSYQQIFGGANSFGPIFAINATANGTAKLWTGAWMAGTLSLQGPNNLNRYDSTYAQSTNPGNVPRVRSYLKEYWTTSRLTMPNLQFTQVKQHEDNHFFSAYGGYLEWMFAGVGGEYLYRPVSSRLAFGVDINRVKQRDFEQNFNFLSPSYLVNTGHATVYWDTGWQNILATVSAGQYLAGDRGGTVNIAKIFRNGMQIGAYATKTNMSSVNYGEGSFDKGIYFSIPFDAFLTKRTNAIATIMYEPFYKDGGAMLQRKYRLYDLTRMRDQRTLSIGAGNQTESLMPVQPF